MLQTFFRRFLKEISDWEVNYLPAPMGKWNQKWSTTWQGFTALSLNKFDSNRTLTLIPIALDTNKKRFCVQCQNRDTPPVALLPGDNRHAEHTLTSRHAPKAAIAISVHSVRWILTRRFLNEMSDSGVLCLRSPFGGSGSRRERNMTRPHRPVAS